MKTITATKARASLFQIIKKSVRGRMPFRITSKEGGAILLSEQDYDELLETLELLSSPGFLKSIQKARQEIRTGETFTMEEVFGKT